MFLAASGEPAVGLRKIRVRALLQERQTERNHSVPSVVLATTPQHGQLPPAGASMVGYLQGEAGGRGAGAGGMRDVRFNRLMCAQSSFQQGRGGIVQLCVPA